MGSSPGRNRGGELREMWLGTYRNVPKLQEGNWLKVMLLFVPFGKKGGGPLWQRWCYCLCHLERKGEGPCGRGDVMVCAIWKERGRALVAEVMLWFVPFGKKGGGPLWQRWCYCLCHLERKGEGPRGSMREYWILVPIVTWMQQAAGIWTNNFLVLGLLGVM